MQGRRCSRKCARQSREEKNNSVLQYPGKREILMPSGSCGSWWINSFKEKWALNKYNSKSIVRRFENISLSALKKHYQNGKIIINEQVQRNVFNAWHKVASERGLFPSLTLAQP